MSIDSIPPMLREIQTANVVPQVSLTRRDRELLVEEGRPPMEVASAEQEALHLQKDEDLREKWKRRRGVRSVRRTHSQDEVSEETDVQIEQPESMQQNPESLEEEETGTLFDDRS